MATISELLGAGLEVTLIGMGVVFVLLTILVGVVHAMSAFSRMFMASPPVAAIESVPDDELISVISAAVNRYRKSQSSLSV